MRTSLRRLGAVATTTALALGGLLASPAQAAPNSYAAPAASWLTGQLPGGLVHTPVEQFPPGLADPGLRVGLGGKALLRQVTRGDT